MDRPESLIRTKLHVPYTRPVLVSRSRLQSRILAGLRGPLTLITAPAGFGKTTLVAASLAECALPVAWLSLDKDDNQPGRFLHYLLAAQQEMDPAPAREAAQLLTAARPATPEHVLTLLVNGLQASGRDQVLALDDYQLVSSQEVHDQVTFLLEHCPRSLHIVIASRSDPPLPLARLRARGLTVELRADDLGFTEAEAAQFLNEVMGLALQPSAVALLQARTEGWIAGLQMAALSLRDQGDVARFVAGFSGTNRYILDYLLDEVLTSQPPDIRQFLLRTSILDRLTAPLCDALLTPDDASPDQPAGTAAHTLDYLERANLFLVPLDDRRTWYRYHHLFAELLRTQLQRQVGVEGVTRLNLRASDWHAHYGSVLEAIEYASRAADEERVERLIEQNYMDLLSRGEQSSMRYWAGKLSKDRVYRRPWLCIYEAYSHAWFGELDETEPLLARAEQIVGGETDSDEAMAQRAALAYVRSRVAAMRGDMPGAIRSCLEAVQYAPAGSLALHFDSRVTLGYEYFLVGDYVHAFPILREAIAAGLTGNATTHTVVAYCFIGRALAVQGQLRHSYRTYQAAARCIPAGDEEHRDAQALLKMGLADVLCEWNQLDEATTQVQQALEWMQFWGKTDDWALAYLTLARIHLARRDLDAAQRAMTEAVDQVQSSGAFPEARQAVEAARVRMWLATGDTDSVDRWARGREQAAALTEELGFEHELANLALARVWLARGRPQQAATLLTRLEAEARSAGRLGRVIESLALLALARRELGDAEGARATLSQCLTLAEPEGYARLLLDEGEPMRSLLALWLARAPAGARRSYAERLLTLFEPAAAAPQSPPATPPPAGLLEPLSQRELEVLHLLALGRTNREIARELTVAAGTVKAHTASIYRKLDVANRTEAAARARQLGLLP